jgi:hypothetical protein
VPFTQLLDEEGGHAELLPARGHYHRMYTNQFAQETHEQTLESGTG